MRRGFLNKQPRDKQPLQRDPPKPSQPPVTVTPATVQAKKIVPIPTGPVEEPDNCDNFDWPKGDFPIAVTHMPPIDPSRHFQLGPHTSCIILNDVKEKLLAIPGFPGPLTAPHPNAYRLGHVPGGGVGMFAARDLRLGELVAVERPLLISPLGLPMSTHDPLALLRKAVMDHMCPDSRAAFLALHNCKSADKSDIWGILNTNAVGIGALPGHNVEYSAVLRDMSRVNHSCCPNAHISWRLPSLSMHLRATEPIPAGSPITISYVGIFVPRSKRQEMLRQMYDFTCTCRSCSLSPSASIESDQIRLLLNTLHVTDTTDESDLKAWIKDPLLPDSYIIDQWMPIWEMAKSESVWHDRIWAAVAQQLCKAYCALEDREKAVEWAMAGLCFSYCWKGEDAGWKDVAMAPEKTAWWGLRKALTRNYCWKGENAGWKDMARAPEKTAWWGLRKALMRK